MTRLAANGHVESGRGVSGVVVRVGRFYLRLLVGIAVLCSVLLGGALLLVWLGASLRSSALLSLSPLLAAVAMVAAIGVLMPVLAILNLLPNAVTQAGRGVLRTMATAAILGLAGAVLALIRPLADHPESVVLLVALSLIALLGAWVAGNRIAEPVAVWARRWAIGVLTVLTLWLAFTAVVPAELRRGLMDHVKARLSERFQPPPLRIPFTSLKELEGIRKFAQVGERVTARVAYCEREDREGFERYLLADRPGQDLYDDCYYKPLSPELLGGIVRYLADWERRMAEARQAPAPDAVAPSPGGGMESVLPSREGGCSDGPSTLAPPAQAVGYSILPADGRPALVLPRKTLLSAELEEDLDVRQLNEGEVVRVQLKETVVVCGAALLAEGTQGRAVVTRVMEAHNARLVYLTLTALLRDGWRETHTTVARAVVSLESDDGLGAGGAGVDARGLVLQFMLVDELRVASGSLGQDPTDRVSDGA